MQKFQTAYAPHLECGVMLCPQLGAQGLGIRMRHVSSCPCSVQLSTAGGDLLPCICCHLLSVAPETVREICCRQLLLTPGNWNVIACQAVCYCFGDCTARSPFKSRASLKWTARLWSACSTTRN